MCTTTRCDAKYHDDRVTLHFAEDPCTTTVAVCDRGKGVLSFNEMVAIFLEEVDIDDLTTNFRGLRALAQST